MSNRKKVGTLLLMLLIGVGLFAFLQRRSEEGPEVRVVQASYDFDAAKPRRLVNGVDNIFIGKVRRQLRTHYLGGSVVPSTLFRVQVLHNIKGELPGVVLVNQDGGYSEAEDAVMVLHGDTLLEPDEVYFFATKVGENGRWHTLVPVFGDVAIRNEAERVELVEKFEKIVAEEQAAEAGGGALPK